MQGLVDASFIRRKDFSRLKTANKPQRWTRLSLQGPVYKRASDRSRLEVPNLFMQSCLWGSCVGQSFRPGSFGGGAVITKSNGKQWVTRLTGQWHCGRIWVLNLAVLTYSDCNILHKSQIFGYSYISCGIHQFPKTKPGIHIVANLLFLSLSELGRFE